MIALIQRTTGAEVSVDGKPVGRIGAGLVALIGVERDDTERNACRLLERVLGYRVFPDDEGRMNRSLADIGGGLLLVPNFTLAADTAKGTRASFTPTAPPEVAESLFTRLLERAQATHPEVAAGVFGADMRVSLTNDGPVTFLLSA